MKNVTGIILAGGRGSRLKNQDKGLLQLNGVPLVSYVIKSIETDVQEIIISANRNIESYRKFGFTVITDQLEPFLGPLGGIYSALKEVKTEYALIVPCDTPLLPTDLCSRLYSRLQETKTDIAIVYDGSRTQQLCMLIRVANIIDTLKSVLDKGKYRVISWIESQSYCLVDFSDTPNSFTNINTGDELSLCEKHIKNQ